MIVASGAVLQGARPVSTQVPSNSPSPSMEEAYRLFYVGRYEESAALALTVRADAPADLATYELRSSALHFRIKREVSGATDKKAAIKKCVPCEGWLADVKADVTAGRTLARDRVKANENDDESRYFLGKLNLTHVWLHLETLGQRTGWGEYWEARKSLDAVIKRQPGHIRALVSRAWIDYIVDTRVPWGVRWMLGGGDKKAALDVAHKAAAAPSPDLFIRAEAGFALWEMLAREKRRPEAVVVAQGLLRDFPENRDLVRFVEAKP